MSRLPGDYAATSMDVAQIRLKVLFLYVFQAERQPQHVRFGRAHIFSQLTYDIEYAENIVELDEG